ncbi:unnamed protein product [Penicillium bialowiezense]
MRSLPSHSFFPPQVQATHIQTQLWAYSGAHFHSDRLSNGRDSIDTARAVEVIIAEHALREHAQRTETMNIRAIASQKAAAVNHDPSQSTGDTEMLDDIKRQRLEKERALYRVVSLLPESERQFYDELRSDPAWFMNEGLYKDCSDQGGCCSRQCGCCAKRHLEAGKGAGHCTPECWCCINDRGFDLSEYTKKEIREDMKLRLNKSGGHSSISPYLLNMVTWNFLPPKAKKTR